MGWNYLSIPKLQRCNRWSLGMDKLVHPTFYNECNYLSMLGLKLNHVSKRVPVLTSKLCMPSQFTRDVTSRYFITGPTRSTLVTGHGSGACVVCPAVQIASHINGSPPRRVILAGEWSNLNHLGGFIQCFARFLWSVVVHSQPVECSLQCTHCRPEWNLGPIALAVK